MKRTKDLQIGLLTSIAAATLAVSGCGSGRSNLMARRCVDGSAAIVDDRYCQDRDRDAPPPSPTGYPYRWYYGGPGEYVPVGERVSGGSYTPPEGVSSFSQPTSGSTVRGVFGGSGEAHGGEAGE